MILTYYSDTAGRNEISGNFAYIVLYTMHKQRINFKKVYAKANSTKKSVKLYIEFYS